MIIRVPFSELSLGQIWKRRNPRTPTSPHILLLAFGTRYGVAVDCVRARLFNGDTGKAGSTTVYPYLDNFNKNYEYLGFLKPEPKEGQVLLGVFEMYHFKVVSVNQDLCVVRPWDKKSRDYVFRSREKKLKLDQSFWTTMDVFWPKN